jgi:ubiquinone/menaquinone biosynthesis C-methylase UbiE
MTDEMLDLARRNAVEAGVTNVEFLRGEIENIPLPRNVVDVIISNCVVNLSPDKDAVIREAYRVLKPGGRIAISDVVTDSDLPDVIKENMAAWTGCIAGALTRDDYIAKLNAAGFENAEIKAAYKRAKSEGLYDRVEQRFGDGSSATVRAYAISNQQEYFAECTESFFTTTYFFPFRPGELARHAPAMFELLKRSAVKARGRSE